MAETAALQFQGAMPQQGEVPGAPPLESAGITTSGAPVQTEGARGGFLGKLFGKGEKGADAPAAQGISPMTLPQRPDIAAGMTDVAGRIGLNVEPVIGGAPRVTVPTPDSGMVIGADTPSNGTIIDDGAKMIVKRDPWTGGRRPSGAQTGETTAVDSMSQMAVGQAEVAAQDGGSSDVGLGNAVGNNESGDGIVAMQAADEIVAAGADVATGQGLENTGVANDESETEAPTGDATITSGTEEVTREDSVGEATQGNSGEPDMSGVGVPPPGETDPKMIPPAPRELTQDEQDAQADREEAAVDAQRLINEGLGEDPAPTGGASGDAAPAIDAAASGDALAAQMRDQGVITGDGEDQVIDATAPVVNEAPDEPVMTDEVIGQTEEAADVRAPEENAAVDVPAMPAEQSVVVGEDAAVEVASNYVVPDADESTGQSEDGASDDDGDTNDAISKDPYRAAMEKDPANDSARILEELHKSDAGPTTDSAGDVISGLREINQTLQEEADRLVEMPLRDAMQELRGKDGAEAKKISTRLAWAHAFKNLEKQGITTLSSIEDVKKVTEEIRGMEELLKLFLEESGEKGGGWDVTKGLTPVVDEPNDPSGASLIKIADAA